MGSLLLAADVSIGLLNGSLIFMASGRGEYIGLDTADTAIAMKALGLDGETRGQARGDAIDDVLVGQLLGLGLLTRSSDEGRPPTLLPPQRPLRELAGAIAGEALDLHVGDVIGLLAAWVVARLVLQFGGVGRAVNRVKRRRSWRSLGFDEPRAERVVSTYRALRVFLFSDRDQCLLNSFVLMEFLAWHGLDATWVFGVRDDPFLAHCWLERDGVLLDDDVERVCDFARLREV